MPRGRPPQGDHPLSDAERQARCQARRQAQQATPIIRYRPPTDRGTRPQRWREAVAELLTLQEAAPGATHCRMPCAIARRAAALETIGDLDLEPLAAIEPPRGYRRD